MPSASEPSPNASVLPAPLAAGPHQGAARATPAISPPDDAVPTPAHPSRPGPSAKTRALAAESELRAAPGVSLEARLRWLERAAAALARRQRRSAWPRRATERRSRSRVELSSLGRLRLSLASRAFPFPAGTELRARDDRYGHLLVWPAASSLHAARRLAPCAPRSARHGVDVTPLSEPSVALGRHRQHARPRRRKSSGSRRASVALELEQARLPNAAGSAARCSADCSSSCWRCRPNRRRAAPTGCRCAPSTPGRPALASSSRSPSSPSAPSSPIDSLAVPPRGASARRGELPGPPFVALDRGARARRACTVARCHRPTKPEPGAPKLGLVFQNRGDGPRYLLVDGVPVVWLRADAEWLVSGLKPGRYTVQARDFFGAESTPAGCWSCRLASRVGDEPERARR